MFTQINFSPRRAVFAAVLSLLAAGSTAALAQSSAAENLQPVGQVCLAGQSCVGQPAGGARSASAAPGTSAPAAASTAPAPAAPAEEPAAASTAAAPADPGFDVEAAYNQSCMACHTTGAAGAPMLGDAAAWETRMEKGMEAVMNNVLNGINAMPARGLCMSCTDDQLAALVDYMANQ